MCCFDINILPLFVLCSADIMASLFRFCLLFAECDLSLYDRAVVVTYSDGDFGRRVGWRGVGAER